MKKFRIKPDQLLVFLLLTVFFLKNVVLSLGQPSISDENFLGLFQNDFEAIYWLRFGLVGLVLGGIYLLYQSSLQLLSHQEDRLLYLAFLVFHPVLVLLNSQASLLPVLFFAAAGLQFLFLILIGPGHTLKKRNNWLTGGFLAVFLILLYLWQSTAATVFTNSFTHLHFSDIWAWPLPSQYVGVFINLQKVLFYSEIAATIFGLYHLYFKWLKKQFDGLFYFCIFGTLQLASIAIISWLNRSYFATTLLSLGFTACLLPLSFSELKMASWKLQTLKLFYLVILLFLGVQILIRA